MLVVTRHRRDVSMAPATCMSQIVVLVAAAPFARPGDVGARDLGLLVALGIGQIGLGLVFLTIGGRLIPAAEVALITLLEVVLGPLWVWASSGAAGDHDAPRRRGRPGRGRRAVARGRRAGGTAAVTGCVRSCRRARAAGRR